MKKLKLRNPSYKALQQRFKEWLDILGYAETTVYNLPHQLQEFLHWLEAHHYADLSQLTPQIINSYYAYLTKRAKEKQSGALSKSYLNKHQQSLKKFNKFLQSHAHKGLQIHLRYESQPPEENHHIITQSEIAQLFKATSYSHKSKRYQLRDKAILVLLYSCGLRRNEAVQLDLKDLYFDKERLHVRKGKNYKERFVPINSKNASILENYLYESRPEFKNASQKEAFLLSAKGRRLQGMGMAIRLQEIIKASGNPTIKEKQITPHSLRHSIATHLLQNEVPLETIKTFLGHRSLESTQRYTHLVKQESKMSS